MIELKKLFDEREQTYKTQTSHILDVIGPTVIQGVFDFFRIQKDQLTWTDVRFGPHPQTGEKLIVLAGVVDYRAGDSVFDQPSNGFVQALEPMSSMIRIALPEKVAANANAETIAEYLQHLFIKKAQPDAPSEDNSESSLTEDPPQLPSALPTVLELAEQGFDMTLLNPEQLSSILVGDSKKGILH